MSKKNTLRLVTLMIAGSMPLAAHSFVDERTPAPAPSAAPIKHVVPASAAMPEHKNTMPAGHSTTAASASALPLAANGLSHQPQMTTTTTERINLTHPHMAPQIASQDAIVTGDLSSAVWQSPYPGPFGKMPLSNALIAQIAPAVGGAIQLNGSDALLDRHVIVPQGLSRADTLREASKQSNININVTGKKVTFSEAATSIAGTPAPVASVASRHVATAVIPGVTEQVAQPQPIPEPKKTWHLKEGDMLSTAMMEWSKEWGWTLIWNASVDYRIAAPITINETFLGGMGKILSAYKRAQRPLWGDWNEQQKVLVINEPKSSLK